MLFVVCGLMLGVGCCCVLLVVDERCVRLLVCWLPCCVSSSLFSHVFCFVV